MDRAPLKQRLRGAPGAALDACAFVLESTPALMCAWLCLRIAEGIHAGAAGVPQSTLLGVGVGNDALTLLRYAFVFMLAALPLAFIASRRLRIACIGTVWSVLLCAQAALQQYHWVSGVPLGADLFAYSGAEVATTVAGGWRASPLLMAALLAALAVLWGVLLLTRHELWPRASRRQAGIVLATSMLAFAFAPGHAAPAVVRTDADLDFVTNKTGFLLDASLAALRGEGAGQATHSMPKGRAPWDGSDPAHPFLHAERTPDTLGPLFTTRAGTPPNLVFIIVEGLGRSFSGPGARLGSFTPFLDELAARSLYFENFLSGQGRTFGVLTTVFGSLPFGEQGMAALGERMPRHDSLLSILKAQGYDLRFYSGSNMDFDNEGLFLRRQGVETIVSEKDFGPPAQRANDWGYADRDLMELALRREARAGTQPFTSIIQTTSMHSPFTFPGKEDYLRRVDQHVARLKLGDRPEYRNGREIFASVLYTDDALRLFFERAAKLPGFDNTVFVITGDHRLPELPMDTRIERYHVPLIVYSPLLKAPRAVKAVSSQFDIAPSLLAWLSKGYGLRTPQQVSWLGTGLDTETSFRNLHAIPLKQTKTELSDFVSGSAYLAQGQLYTLSDGMAIDRAENPAAQAQAKAQFAAFLKANRLAGQAEALAPPGVPLAAYGGERSLHGVPLVQASSAVGVRGMRVRPGAGALAVEATFTNSAGQESRAFAPLLVLTNEHGLELGETTGEVRTLAPGESATITLRPDLKKLPPGTYYLSVIPSNPETGHSIGVGQYHVALKL
jgi:hypothetical protein